MKGKNGKRRSPPQRGTADVPVVAWRTSGRATTQVSDAKKKIARRADGSALDPTSRASRASWAASGWDRSAAAGVQGGGDGATDTVGAVATTENPLRASMARASTARAATTA